MKNYVINNTLLNNKRCIVDLEGGDNFYDNNGDCVVYYGDRYKENLFALLIIIFSIIFIGIALTIFYFFKKKYLKKKKMKFSSY